ncbi:MULTISPECIES: CheR family methyltransferase [unclassified Shinella]|jgi:chemotaxis protein methyltransferase CheR|uniref:CheR family methyltransferase n=1 Tax=unclassified Shinella TaxID=2643062 RepID=UPI00056BFF66|nr:MULTISPECIES: protein-glutamate O-methyltransferase CheR [unclassified Shinella]MCA0342434.1 protein-glutamate O-methyltransferase CheR [Pseudomonadota bacterium]KNY14771.1 chemotaxis protein CheR [Shinella sp. SUS2]KOC74423.1 chemotaxis protein CheR [Shinella sp. GWS1]MCO5152864.1 protein-glutamate O-methyltransferase CheR [Shinella sp.]MDC7260856.1 protein-glutamate O-methyltransferase CheR [Shinella sp. HY16]
MGVGAALRAQGAEDGLSNRNFEALSRYIYDYSGIKMPITKLTMLEGRLRRRLRATGIASFNDYCDYLFKHGGIEKEAIFLIDAVTTNKTDFFREPKHFEYMAATGLPEMVAAGHKRLRLWSAACSIGAEPYTMAMVMQDFVDASSGLDYRILATDLSTEVLAAARRGVYPRDMIQPVPAEMQRRYVMVSRHAGRGEVRIHPRLRSTIGFARMNLMDSVYKVGDPMHMIFCRNVLIYFDKPTQAKVLSRLCDCLVPGGFLYVGHSETVTGISLPVRQVANTVFKKI